jgi:glycosyltransferase involved in cell wall biosynthesis
MKLAIVVQRYGLEINGGAELHARYIAERLARHADVEVLTTCARDYVTWRNEYEPGVESINGLPVRRFPVVRERDTREFGLRSEQVFHRRHSFADELRWLSSQGPTSPALLDHLVQHEEEYDYCLFFSYRYYHAYHGIRAVAGRALLVPTAERDPTIGLSLFGPAFRGVRGILYNSFEERALIQEISENHAVPSVVVGVGSEVPDQASAPRFRERTGMTGRFALYVGRIDPNKGCVDLFGHFRRYAAEGGHLDLVLAGSTRMPVPDNPRIRHLGFVSDEEKYDAMAAADLLIMPSPYESLSMVTLEAWAMGLPVLVNGACDVLRGQVVRSNAGLYYTNYPEFAETLRLLEDSPRLRAGLGAQGRRYFDRHYTWPVIEQKYLDLLHRLQQEDPAAAGRALEPTTGWLGRRRRRLPPAAEVVERAPRGPVLPRKGQESAP